MRIRLTAPWPEPRRLQTAGILEPADFAVWLEEPEHAVAELARIMPHRFVETPFPGQPSKFDVLNGWRVARSTYTTRTGFRRARLFRTRGADAALRFEIRSAEPVEFTFHINARPTGRAAVAANWTAVSIDVSAVAVGEAFVLEFRREGTSDSFEASCFDVQLPSGKESLGSRVGKWVRGKLPKRWRQRLRAK